MYHYFHEVPVILRNNLQRESHQPLRQVHITWDKLSHSGTHCGDDANDNGSFDSQ
jgi:hypothetical protein